MFIFFYRLSVRVEILQGFTKFNFKLKLKVSAVYLEKQKSFIPKKCFMSQEWTGFNIKTTSFVYRSNFWVKILHSGFWIFRYLQQICCQNWAKTSRSFGKHTGTCGVRPNNCKSFLMKNLIEEEYTLTLCNFFSKISNGNMRSHL